MTQNQNQHIKDLASAVSTQARVANRLWLTLMTVVVFTLLQLTGAGQQTQGIALPLGLGSVSPETLYPVLFSLLIILSVAFASAHAQQVRARKLAEGYIGSLSEVAEKPHPREFFDMLCQPSVIRVAPLAQSLRGKYQFFATAAACPDWLWWTSAAYYVLLKASAILIYFLVPGWALILVGIRLWKTDAVPLILLVVAPIAFIPLLQVILNEVASAWKTLCVITKRPGSEAPERPAHGS
ncbi:MAG: hypothetical protein ABII00_17720 [Elusimicrobiota bacterium]